jgi:large subunit ribosomal protein L4
MPKKMRRLALKCALSAKAGDGELMILDELKLDEPKTKEMVRILGVLGIDSSALITTAEPEETVVKSARNLPRIKTIPANLLNVIDILSHRMLLMTEPAVHKAERIWGKKVSKGGSSASL